LASNVDIYQPPRGVADPRDALLIRFGIGVDTRSTLEFRNLRTSDRFSSGRFHDYFESAVPWILRKEFWSGKSAHGQGYTKGIPLISHFMQLL
jgi:hypothetical protein